MVPLPLLMNFVVIFERMEEDMVKNGLVIGVD